MTITVLLQIATLHGLHNLTYVGGSVFVEDALSLRHADDLRQLASVGAMRGTLPPLDPWYSHGRMRNVAAITADGSSAVYRRFFYHTSTAIRMKKSNALVIMKMKDGTPPDLSGLSQVNGERRAACPAGSVPHSTLAAESCKFLDFGSPPHPCRNVLRITPQVAHANRPCPAIHRERATGLCLGRTWRWCWEAWATGRLPAVRTYSIPSTARARDESSSARARATLWMCG